MSEPRCTTHGRELEYYCPECDKRSENKELKVLRLENTAIKAERDTLKTEVERLVAERRRDALDGQATMEEANNEIVRLKEVCIEITEKSVAREASLSLAVGGLEEIANTNNKIMSMKDLDIEVEYISEEKTIAQQTLTKIKKLEDERDG